MGSRRGPLLAVWMAVAMAGCGETPTTSPVVPSPLASAVSREQIQAWITFRLVYGLRADVEWVVEVANDPAATDIFGTPLLLFEAQHVTDAQQRAANLVSTARGYGNRFPDEFAGTWIEGPLVVLAFSSEIEVHRANAASLFGEKVVVRAVQFSLRELEPFAAKVTDDRGWFETLGAELVDADVDEMLNVVNVHLRWPDPSVETQARARFGDTGWMAFTYDGPPPWTGPRGGLEITVVDRHGHPASVECLLGSPDPRVQQEEFSAPADGKCFYEDLPAVKWSLRVDYESEAGLMTAFEEFQVSAGRVERATVVVGP